MSIQPPCVLILFKRLQQISLYSVFVSFSEGRNQQLLAQKRCTRVSSLLRWLRNKMLPLFWRITRWNRNSWLIAATLPRRWWCDAEHVQKLYRNLWCYTQIIQILHWGIRCCFRNQCFLDNVTHKETGFCPRWLTTSFPSKCCPKALRKNTFDQPSWQRGSNHRPINVLEAYR